MPRSSKSDQVISILLTNLDLAFDKVAWQGPNLASCLRGVCAEMARKRVLGRRSIWEQTLHAAYWKQRVLNKLIGTQKFPRSGSNWPHLPTAKTEANWRADVQLLHQIHIQLRFAVAKLTSVAIDERNVKLILGAAAHDTYHAGQIRLIRRLLGLSRKG